MERKQSCYATMNAQHVITLQTALNTRVPVSVGTYQDNIIVASAGTRDARNVSVWQVFAAGEKVKSLGHRVRRTDPRPISIPVYSRPILVLSDHGTAHFVLGHHRF